MFLAAFFTKIVPGSIDKNKAEYFIRTFLILLISYSFFFAQNDYSSLLSNSLIKLKTPKGFIYTDSSVASTYGEAIKYLETNSKKEDKIIIWPETPFLNFVMEKDSDNFYLTTIPLYTELFGEDKIIENLKKTKPEFIIFTNRDSSDYGKKYICKDYAEEICKYVRMNYASDKMIGASYSMIIYKRKDIK